ncbi:lactoylglutathione lyase [Actinosynnema pretiosum]|nr:lactoylglutathione lyase [Actinosynnema pretiosum]
MVMGSRQVKVGLRVADLDRSRDLYLAVGFKEIPNDEQPTLRYLTHGRTWLILSDRQAHPYISERDRVSAQEGPVGAGFVLAVPVSDVEALHRWWAAQDGLEVVLPPEDAGWAVVFQGADYDGYQVMFEQFRN